MIRTFFLTTAALLMGSHLLTSNLIHTAFAAPLPVMTSSMSNINTNTKQQRMPERLPDIVRSAHSYYLRESIEDIEIIGYRPQVWDNSCLGLDRPNQNCLEVLTVGWAIEVSDGDAGSTSLYHTDENGRNYGIADTSVFWLPPQRLPESVQESVREAYASDLNLPVEDVYITSFQEQTWNDGCLGVGRSDESCLTVLTEGWSVEVANLDDGRGSPWVRLRDRTITYHSDSTGDTVRRATTRHSRPPTHCPRY